jgi:exonuclease SbcD
MNQESTVTGLRVAHMSDLHYCEANLAEADRCFGAAVDAAIDRNVAAAIITGDSTDHALDAHEPAMLALMRQIKRLADHCPVLMLQGTFSHEPPGFLRVMSMIGAQHEIQVADRIKQFVLTQEGYFVPSSDQLVVGDKLVVSALPTLNKADLVAMTLDGDGQASQAKQIGEVLYGVLKGFAPLNQKARILGIPSMVISHGTVDMCETEHGVPMAGNDHELGVGALFSADADAVALGHIHKHQSWNNGFAGKDFMQVIAYAGSIGRFHHGELGDKGCLMWTISPGNPHFELVSTPTRKTVDIFFDGEPDLEVIKQRAQECVGAFVRVRYYFPEESRAAQHREGIRALLEAAAGVQIEAKPLYVERQRAPGISTANSVADKLVHWCEVTQTNPAPLTERLGTLVNAEPGAIAQEFMDKLLGRVARPRAVAKQAEPAAEATASAQLF